MAWVEQKLLEIVPLSTTFRAKVGASSQADAARFVFRSFLLPSDLHTIERPSAVVEMGEFALRRVDLQHLRPDPEMTLILTDWVRFPDDLGASTTDFKNFVGGVMDDIGLLQGTDDLLTIESLVVPVGKFGIVDPAAGAPRKYFMADVQVRVSKL
jgi:hypothetical protein